MLARTAEIETMLAQLDAPARLEEALAGPSLPGQLGLAGVYAHYDADAQDATRVFHVDRAGVAIGEWYEDWTIIDKSVNTLRFVVAGKQSDSTGCNGYFRGVEIWNGPADSDPDAAVKEWIPISPTSTRNPPPSNWQVRNSTYDDVPSSPIRSRGCGAPASAMAIVLARRVHAQN